MESIERINITKMKDAHPLFNRACLTSSPGLRPNGPIWSINSAYSRNLSYKTTCSLQFAVCNKTETENRN